MVQDRAIVTMEDQ